MRKAILTTISSLLVFVQEIYYVSSFVGRGNFGNVDGNGTAAMVNDPREMAFKKSTGEIYLADYGNDRIRVISPSGLVSTLNIIAGNPVGVVFDAFGNLFVSQNNWIQIGKIDKDGIFRTFDLYSYNSDSFIPSAITIDASNNLYVCATDAHKIYKITSGGEISLFAGSSVGIADGIGNAAKFNKPWGITIDSSGNLYVTDSLNHAIRKIYPNQTVIKLAGAMGNNGYVDGPGSTARFDRPRGISIDSNGYLYEADRDNYRIIELGK